MREERHRRNDKGPSIWMGLCVESLVAWGGIEPPTRGFSIVATKRRRMTTRKPRVQGLRMNQIHRGRQMRVTPYHRRSLPATHFLQGI
jgi:hypothetical protein